MYGNFNPNNQIPTRQRITVEQAQAIAIQTVPGTVVHIDLDLDDGVVIYEVYVLTAQNIIFEVKINARTGRVLDIEQEDDDNDFDFIDD